MTPFHRSSSTLWRPIRNTHFRLGFRLTPGVGILLHWGSFLTRGTCDPTDVFCALKDGQFGFVDALDVRHQVFQPETQMLPYLCKDTQEIKQ